MKIELLPGREPRESAMQRFVRLRWHLLIAVWLLLLSLGIVLMVDKDARPGPAAVGPKRWPEGSTLALAPSGKTMVMFLHPACPCSLASLEELDRLVQRKAVPSTVCVVMVGPASLDRRQESRNRSRAAEIPDAILRSDSDGREAQRFGSQTSGTLLVFDAGGQLEFSGGITRARGHVGPNAAWDAAAAALDGHAAEPRSMPVFGCPLF